jgi:hypothetical protein
MKIQNNNDSIKLMKQMNVIIYATIRDIKNHFLSSLFSNIDILCSYFNKCFIIILENDSKDNTRKLLKQWSVINNDSNKTKHIILLDNLDKKYPLRAHRLAFCRNKILDFIFKKKLDEKYQYAIHCDPDDKLWSINFDSLSDCFCYDLNMWDAMTCVNKGKTYYDYWALRCENTWFNRNIFSCELEKNKFVEMIPEFINLLKSTDGLISVNSSFNGMGVYKLKSLYKCRYNANYNCLKCNGKKKDCLEDNDHIGLHREMIKKGSKIFINTNFYTITLPDNAITYNNFIKNMINKIPNIQKNPLIYFLITNSIDKEGVWLEFGTGNGETSNLITTYYNNTLYSFDMVDVNENSHECVKPIYINKNVEIIKGNISEILYNFKKTYIIKNNISFIYINCDSYQSTKYILDNLCNKISNNCIIIFSKLINYSYYFIYQLKAFYEFTQEYNINFEWLGMNNKFDIRCQDNNEKHFYTNNEIVAVKIISNPFLNEISCYDIDIDKNSLEYNNFDWEFYVNINHDLNHIIKKEDAWIHYIKHGKDENRINVFDWNYYIIKYNLINLGIKTKNDALEHWLNNGKNYFSDIKNIELSHEEINYFLFDWKFYISQYNDLSCIQTKDEAYHHWINYGIHENRISNNFNWIEYLKKNSDLTKLNITTKQKAIDHWIKYGKEEGRSY